MNDEKEQSGGDLEEETSCQSKQVGALFGMRKLRRCDLPKATGQGGTVELANAGGYLLGSPATPLASSCAHLHVSQVLCRCL